MLCCFPGLPIVAIADCHGTHGDEISHLPGLDYFRWGETHASYWCVTGSCNEIMPLADLIVIFSLAIH